MTSDSTGENETLDVEYVTGFRLKSVLLYHTAAKMLYTKHNQYNSKISYRCYNYRTGCTAKVVVTNGICTKLKSCLHSSHADHESIYREMHVRNSLKLNVMEKNSLGLRQIFDGVVNAE